MPETWASANARMACLACGESGAHPYFNAVGLPVRVCARCTPTWAGLRPRGGLLAGEGPRASDVAECADEVLRIGWAFARDDSRRDDVRALAGRVRALGEAVTATSGDDVMDLVRHLNRTEVCGGCKREVTPDLCHCGETRTMHPPEHQFVPMGCDCYRDADVGGGDAPW